MLDNSFLPEDKKDSLGLAARRSDSDNDLFLDFEVLNTLVLVLRLLGVTMKSSSISEKPSDVLRFLFVG